MLIPSDPGQAERIRSERNQGRAVDMNWLDHDRLGFNYRLSDVSAAIGVAQVAKIDRILGNRARTARLYAERLTSVEGVEVPFPYQGQTRRSWFVYPVRLAEGSDRDGVIRALAEVGVPAKAYLPCIHLIPHIRKLGYEEGQFPVAEGISARSLALPFHGEMTEADVDRVANSLGEALVAAAKG